MLSILRAVPVLCLVILALAACDDTVPHEADVGQAVSAKLDPGLTHEEKALLIGDLYTAMQYDIEAVQGSYFALAFGGPKTSNVLEYLDARVNYVLPESVRLESRLSYGDASGLVAALGQVPLGADDGKVFTVAVNVGTELWFEGLSVLPKKLQFSFGNQDYPINTPRIGILQLGPGYVEKGSPGRDRLPAVVRVAELIHQARHSDCTGGLNAADLGRIQAGQLPVNLACGHLHVACPAGNPYAGLDACDSHPWGAYAIETLYSLGIAKACKNCSAEDKKIAQLDAADSLTRVLDMQDLIDGRLGPPDMSSTNAVPSKSAASRSEIASLRAARAAEPTSSSLRLDLGE